MLGKMKGFFFEEGEEESTPAPKLEQPVAPVSVPTLQAVLPSVASTPVSSGKFKEKLLTEVQTKFGTSAYLQFQKIATGMKVQITDLATRTVATVASLSAQGTTKDKILFSANEVMEFLKAEGASFQQEIANDIAELDKQFVSKSEKIASDLASKQEQIKKLSEEISALQIEKSQAEITLTENKTKLQVTKMEFEGSINTVMQEINTDISDITKFGV